MTNYLTSAGVQQFSITIASGSTTGTATINAVGAGAFILAGGINPSVSNNPSEDFAYPTLTNSTTITATRNTGTAGSVVVTGCIIDGDTTNLIKSVQYGTATIANLASSGTATISTVTNANAAVHLLGWQSANTTLSGINEYPIVALSGTTVTATRTGVTGALVVGFVVIEFQSSVLNQSVQNVAATDALSATSYTATINSVVTNNSISIYAGCNVAVVTTNIAEVKQYGSLTNSTTFTVNVNTAIANLKSYNCSVVEFVSGILNSAVQRGTTTLTGVTSNTTTLSGINALYSGLSWLGNTTTATTAVLDRAEGAATLNVTTIAFVQNKGHFIASGSSISATITSSAVGNLLVVCIQTGGSTNSISSVTDSASQTWLQATGAAASTASRNSISDIWYFPNTASGVTTVTVNFSSVSSGPVDPTIVVFEISGAKTSSVLGNTAALNNATGSGTTYVGPAVSSTNPGSIIFSLYNNGSNAGASVASPYIIDSAEDCSAYHITTSKVINESASFTLAASGLGYCASAAEFLASNIITVTKATAAANITGSWEVVEFPAFAQIVYNDFITESSTSSDSESGAATDNALLSETGVSSDSASATSVRNVILTESDTSSDSYKGGKATSDVLTESSTSSDSEAANSSGKGLFNETSTASDLENGALTINGNTTETIISGDAFLGISGDNISFTETDTSSDSYTLQTGGIVYNDFITETIAASDSETGNSIDVVSLSENSTSSDVEGGKLTLAFSLTESLVSSDSYTLQSAIVYNDFITESSVSSDSLTGKATDSTTIGENVAANDNYNPNNQNATIGVSQPGPADGDEDIRRRKWLEYKKKKIINAYNKAKTISPANKELAQAVSPYKKSKENSDLPPPIERIDFYNLLKEELDTSKLIGVLNSINLAQDKIEESNLAYKAKIQREQERKTQELLKKKIIEKSIIAQQIAKKKALEQKIKEEQYQKLLAKQKADREDEALLIMLGNVF